MKRIRSAVVFSIVLFAASIVFPQERQVVPNVMNAGEIDALVQKVANNEEAFRLALTNYVFTRNATVQEIGLGDLIVGTYKRVSSMTFTISGERFERITYFPISTLRNLQITNEDIEDLGGVNPFAINPNDISMYTFSYIGKQRIDDLNLHVFDVRPKFTMKEDKITKRYFTGRIWVDDRDLMIVKSRGKGVPEGKQRFPVVETWRTNVDGKYWFPAYSYADEELVFEKGNVIRIRLKVSYDEYKVGRSEVIILDDDTEVLDNEKPKEGAAPPLKDN